MLKKVLILALIWGVAAGAPALAAGNHQDGPGLTPQNFNHRLEAVERALAEQKETAAPERATPSAALFGERLTLSGLVEVEAVAAEDFTGNTSSDISLATVEIGLDASLSPWAGAHLVFLHEGSDCRLTRAPSPWAILICCPYTSPPARCMCPSAPMRAA
jgi:hypothetical protein